MGKIIPVEVKKVVETTTTSTMKITGVDLIELLSRGGGPRIPPGAVVAFRVPGGGDWSNEDVPIDEQHPITVSWSMREVR